MPVTPEKIFIYGTFRSEKDDVLWEAVAVVMGGAGTPDIAIEILREFSPTELIGKVYTVSRSGSWAPVSQPGIQQYNWYKDFPGKGAIFTTAGSNPWKVLFFRQESDESGPYVAVGLRLHESK